MARAATTSIQFKSDQHAPRGSGTMLVAERAARTLPPNALTAQDKPVVLVVDDDEDLRESLVRMLSECDLVAVGATSSLNALDILQHSSVDIVVSDQFTWGMDGVSLLSAVRKRWPHVQRVLFTAEASPDIMVDAVNRGGVHKVLLKTMHAVQIRDEIEGVALAALRRHAGIID
jgi:DNA-binding NtrC family response regulator